MNSAFGLSHSLCILLFSVFLITHKTGMFLSHVSGFSSNVSLYYKTHFND